MATRTDRIAAVFLGVLLAACVFLAAAPAKAQDQALTSYAVLKNFYAARDYKLVWVDGEEFTGPGEKLPEVLAGAVRHGIDPAAYNVPRMQAVLKDEMPQGVKGWMQAEMLWSYSLWSYASDLAGEPVDAAALAEIVAARNMGDALDKLAPQTDLYKKLEDRLGELAENKNPRPMIDLGARRFDPGMTHPDIPVLRAALVRYGAGNDRKSLVYDATLVKAVQRFQREHGLADDGVIGADTRNALNRTPAQERQQIVANMDRMRQSWARNREDKRIDVAIARYQLTAYEGGKPLYDMPVIVGQPKRQTVAFKSEIQGVRLNPTWTVPDTIKQQDFLPQLQNNPEWANKQGLKLYAHNGGTSERIDPTTVDWSKVRPSDLGNLRMMRPAGDGNPLGKYRVIMANRYDIYLHDTNHPAMFKASTRAFSSGCVRVNDPAKLTAFILGEKPGWNIEKTQKIVQSGKTVDVLIENKIPIYLDYFTTWIDSHDQLVLGVDIYRMDKPRYDSLVKYGLKQQRDAQIILNRAEAILTPDLQEAQNINRPSVLSQ